MDSVIIISNSELMREELINYNFPGTVFMNNLSDLNRISMQLENGRIYFDCECDILENYDDWELDKIEYDKLFFTVVSYSTKRALFTVLKTISNYCEVIIDDDHGYIGGLQEYLNKIIK